MQRLQGIVAETEAVTSALAGDGAAGPRRARTAPNEQLDAAAAARRQADADHHRWAARAETLAQALDQARARAGAERLEEMAGFMGALLELVEVDEGFEAAFEAAAGEPWPRWSSTVSTRPAGRSPSCNGRVVAGAVVALPEPGVEPGPARGPAAAWHWPRSDTAVLRPPGCGPGCGHGFRASGSGWISCWPAPWWSTVTGQAAVDLAIAHPELVVVTREGDRCAHGLWQLGAGSRGTTGAAVEEARQQAADGGTALRLGRARLAGGPRRGR